MDEELDYEVADHGSIISITPLTDAAREWLDENALSEPWQWLGRVLCIEARVGGDLLFAMQEAGLTSNVTVTPR